MENKQCVYCRAKENLKEMTFVVQEEEQVEFTEYVCKHEKCMNPDNF